MNQTSKNGMFKIAVIVYFIAQILYTFFGKIMENEN